MHYKLVLLNFGVKYSYSGVVLSIYVRFFLSTFSDFYFTCIYIYNQIWGGCRGGDTGKYESKDRGLTFPQNVFSNIEVEIERALKYTKWKES